MKEIYREQDASKLIQEGINDLTETVCYTYGPNGNTVIIIDEYGNPYATKDGVSVAKSIHFDNPVKNIGTTLIKQVAKKTLDEAGDATTTSICLANEFINLGYDLLEKGIQYRVIKELLEELLEETISYLKSNKRKVNKKDLKDIAFISSNSDKNISTIVANAFNHSSVVKVEEGNDIEDKLEEVNGMKIRATYFDQSFINNENKYNIQYNESLLLIIDGKLNSVEPIAGILNKVDKPIIIMADHFEDNVVNILKENYNRGALQVALVKSPGIGGHRKKVVQDIALYTGAKVINPNTKYFNLEVLGKLEAIEVNKESTILFNNNKNKETEKRIKILKKYLSSDISKHEKELVTQRLEQLNGSVSIIKVGGKSEIEIKERLDRVDDAVKAVTCALEEGVIEGGGVALLKAHINIDNPFSQCLAKPYKIIFKDKTVEINGEFVYDFDVDIDMFKERIIDPFKVVRCALENSISVTKTILGTKAVVLTEDLWKK